MRAKQLANFLSDILCWPVCKPSLPTGRDVPSVLSVATLAIALNIHASAVHCCGWLMSAKGWLCSPCRYVATGSVVPLMPASSAAVYAAELAEAAFRAGKLVDEAPLIQLLQHCSVALSNDVLAAAALTAAYAEAGAGIDSSTEPAARSAAASASAAADLGPYVNAADSRHGAALSQAPAAAGRPASGARSAGWPPAAEPDNGVKQPLQRHSKGPPSEWESKWARSVAVALQVLQVQMKSPQHCDGAAPILLRSQRELYLPLSYAIL